MIFTYKMLKILKILTKIVIMERETCTVFRPKAGSQLNWIEYLAGWSRDFYRDVLFKQKKIKQINFLL